MEAAFDEVDGVTETISGYAGGTRPKSELWRSRGLPGSGQGDVRSRQGDLREAARPLLAQYRPVRSNGQFCDKGSAYQSVIFAGDDAEKTLGEKTKQEIADRFKQTVATEIKPATTFTAAEDYHQDYHNQNPVSYKYYKWGCGRAQRLEQIWGKPS